MPLRHTVVGLFLVRGWWGALETLSILLYGRIVMRVVCVCFFWIYTALYIYLQLRTEYSCKAVLCGQRSAGAPEYRLQLYRGV